MAKVLIVISHDRFQDEELEALTKALESSNHQFQIGSTHHTEAKGYFGLIVKPDVNIGFVEPGDYDAIVFVGGHGVEEYFMDSDVINLIRYLFSDKKLVAAIGLAVEIFVYAGIITGRKVTCIPSLINNVQGAGAYYTGRPVELDGDILTGTDSRTRLEFAEALVKALDHLDPRRGLR